MAGLATLKQFLRVCGGMAGPITLCTVKVGAGPSVCPARMALEKGHAVDHERQSQPGAGEKAITKKPKADD